MFQRNTTPYAYTSCPVFVSHKTIVTFEVFLEVWTHQTERRSCIVQLVHHMAHNPLKLKLMDYIDVWEFESIYIDVLEHFRIS